MATIKIPYTRPPEEIEISIDGFYTDLGSKVANIEISFSHEAGDIIPVDLMPIFDAATATQKTVIIAWHKAIVAAGINQSLGTDFSITDIPDTIFS